MFDRFSIVIGHYMFCMHYHGGQNSALYARMCRIGRYFNLGVGWKDRYLWEEENEIALMVYNQLEQKHGFDVTPEYPG